MAQLTHRWAVTRVTAHGKHARRAVTHYRVIKKYPRHTHIQVNLETGRTHQIRVHMAHIHHPLVGDRTYGRKGPSNNFPRQALHARRLALIHPVSGEICSWESPLPVDMVELLRLLEKR